MKKLITILLFMLFFSVAGFAQKSTTSMPEQPWKIRFNNNTNYTIYVAIRYKNTYGTWETKYWFKYGAYEKDETNNSFVVTTNNRYFYVYARTKSTYNGNYRYWGGYDNYKYVEGKSVGFKKYYITNDKLNGTPYTININY